MEYQCIRLLGRRNGIELYSPIDATEVYPMKIAMILVIQSWRLNSGRLTLRG